MSESEYFDLDFNKIEIIKGKTPEDIKQKCHELCKDYLGSIWSEICVDDIELKRISGGFSNQLYYCALPSTSQTSADEPHEVAVRLYGHKCFNNLCLGNDRHSDVIVSLLVSERNLGPKLFGSFPEGDILQYIRHRQFRIEEQREPKLVVELARKLAKFHAMKVPLRRNTDWLLKTMDMNLENAYKLFPIDRLIDEYDCHYLKSNSLSSELVWLKQCIFATDSPIVFSHNDFRANNIMVLQEFDINSNVNTEDNCILFCDFECSAYGYRGTDLGTIFAEWNRDLNGYKTIQDFPDDSTIKPFIDEYIRESIQINGNQFSNERRNSFKQILKEIKVFTLVSNIFMIMASLVLEPPKEVPLMTKKLLMTGANIHFKNYLHLKNKFIEDMTITSEK